MPPSEPSRPKRFDLAGLAVLLASRASAYNTCAVIPVDGGYLLNQKETIPC